MFVTLWFAVAFLCAVQRRRGVMLGKKRRRPSDVCCFVFEGRCYVMRGGGGRGERDMLLLLTGSFFFVCRLALATRRSATRPFLFLVWAAGSR